MHLSGEQFMHSQEGYFGGNERNKHQNNTPVST